MNRFKFWDHHWALSITAGILLGLSFPPFDLSILQIPAFICLFRLMQISTSWRQAIYYAYPSLVLWNLIVTYWLMMATITGGIAAILANAAIMLLPLLLIRSLFGSSIHPVLQALVATALWISYEFLHHHWDLAWPWLTLGNGWANLTGPIQFISVTGVHGISFWILFSAALFYKYLEEPVKPLLYSGILVFLAFPVFSVLATITVQSADGDPVEVAVIQPNSDSYEQHGGHGSIQNLLDYLLTLSSNVVTENTDLILWPENAIDTGLPLRNYYFDVISDSLRAWNTQLITGSGFLEYFGEDNLPPVYRTTINDRHYIIFNAAFQLTPDKEPVVYRKAQLVPVVERPPFLNFFAAADILGLVDWGSQMGYGRGTEMVNFDVNGHSTPALICYDSVFSSWVNRSVNKGADFLTIITNDGWWGDSNGHLQHFAYARIRAIEQRRWIARSANNGISGIMSPDGKVQLQTEYWTEDAFTFTIYTNQQKTFYARYGEWFAQLMLIISALGLVLISIRRK